MMSLEQACKRNYQPCIDQALTLFKEYRENPAINPYVSGHVTSIVVVKTAVTGGGGGAKYTSNYKTMGVKATGAE